MRRWVTGAHVGAGTCIAEAVTPTQEGSPVLRALCFLCSVEGECCDLLRCLHTSFVASATATSVRGRPVGSYGTGGRNRLLQIYL